MSHRYSFLCIGFFVVVSSIAIANSTKAEAENKNYVVQVSIEPLIQEQSIPSLKSIAPEVNDDHAQQAFPTLISGDIEPFVVLFDFDSAALGVDQLDALAGFVDSLQKGDKIIEVRLVGHADSRGREVYNRILSQRRANSVLAYLADQGISIHESIGMGESAPIIDDLGKEDYQRSRRVEIYSR